MTIYRHVQVKVPEELAVWYDRAFPGLSKQDFLLGCLEGLKRLTSSGVAMHQKDLETASVAQAIISHASERSS